jgi:hypothetical protein
MWYVHTLMRFIPKTPKGSCGIPMKKNSHIFTQHFFELKITYYHTFTQHFPRFFTKHLIPPSCSSKLPWYWRGSLAAPLAPPHCEVLCSFSMSEKFNGYTYIYCIYCIYCIYNYINVFHMVLYGVYMVLYSNLRFVISRFKMGLYKRMFTTVMGKRANVTIVVKMWWDCDALWVWVNRRF